MTSTVRRTLAIATAAALIGGLAFSWIVGGELVAPAPCAMGAPPAELAARTVMFGSDSGSTIHGWLSPGKSGQGVVLLLHGVRGSRLDMLSRAEFLHRLGYSVLLMDFQAHGESPGSKITFGHLESLDVEAALRFLNDRYPGERIGVIGTSMGAAAMVLTAHRAKVQAVVLESMYPTIDQATEDRLRLYLGRMGIVFAPLLTGQLRLRLGIDPAALRPIARMRDLQAPVFIISGTLDRHTTIEEAKSIYAAAGEPKRLWAVEGAEHVDLHRFAPVEYETRVANFLGTYLRPSVP